MKLWPFGRSEKREAGYTDAIVAGIIARASGSAAAVAGATAALETAAGHVGRAFAAADVAGPAFAREVLDPGIADADGPRADPQGRDRAGDRREHAGVAPGDELGYPRGAGPDDVELPRHHVEPVLHDHADHAGRRGPSPALRRRTRAAVGWSRTRAGCDSRRQAVRIARRFADRGGRHDDGVRAPDAGRRRRSNRGAAQGGSQGNERCAAPCRVGPEHARGRGDRGAGSRLATAEARPNPPASEVALFTAANLEVLACCGVPPSLAAAGAEGTAQREAFRRFLHLCVAPLARLVEAELSDKLDGEVSLSFDGLFAGDLSGRARAFQSLVGGGWTPARPRGSRVDGVGRVTEQAARCAPRKS